MYNHYHHLSRRRHKEHGGYHKAEFNGVLLTAICGFGFFVCIFLGYTFFKQSSYTPVEAGYHADKKEVPETHTIGGKFFVSMNCEKKNSNQKVRMVYNISKEDHEKISQADEKEKSQIFFNEITVNYEPFQIIEDGSDVQIGFGDNLSSEDEIEKE